MAVLFAVAACNEAATEQAAPRPWVYPPAVAAWPLGAVTGTIGRSQAPDVALAEGITGPATLQPLRVPTPWAVPGEGPARAIVYGLIGTTHAIELIDIDAGRVLWRDTTGCGAPVVGVTAQVACSGRKLDYDADADGNAAVAGLHQAFGGRNCYACSIIRGVHLPIVRIRKHVATAAIFPQ
jgi:hypothetical protein